MKRLVLTLLAVAYLIIGGVFAYGIYSLSLINFGMHNTVFTFEDGVIVVLLALSWPFVLLYLILMG